MINNKKKYFNKLQNPLFLKKQSFLNAIKKTINSSFLLSDFVDIQRKSFFELLEKGLIEEFSKRNPITNKHLEIFFYPEYYQLTPPEYNPRRAILYSKSYSAKLFIPAQLTDKKLKKSQLKWVLIGNLPLMTKRGHFILNGAPRVIVNQILRSPGIYFQGSLKEIFSEKWSEKPDITYKRFYADLICLKGTWLRIEIDKNKDIWAQMNKIPKIPILWFLLAMGLTERIIFKSVINPTRLLANFNLDIKRKINYHYVTNPSDAWKEIANLISSKQNFGTSSSNNNKELTKSKTKKKIILDKSQEQNPDSNTLNFAKQNLVAKKTVQESESNNKTTVAQLHTIQKKLMLELTKTGKINSSIGKSTIRSTMRSIGGPLQGHTRRDLVATDPKVTYNRASSGNPLSAPLVPIMRSMSNPSKVYLALVQAYAKAQLNRKNILTSSFVTKLGLVYPSIYYAKHKGAPAKEKFKESFRYAQQLRSSKRAHSLNNKANTLSVWLKYKKNLARLKKQSFFKAKPLLVGGVHVKHTRVYNFTKKNKNLISFLTFSEQSKEGRNWIFKRFMNPRTYDLGKQGRLNFNRKLGLSIASTQTTLTAQDVLYTTDYLLKLEKGLKNIDDIDHLKNRRVRTSGELLQIQIGIGLVRLEKMIRECLALKINTQHIKKYPSHSTKNLSNSTTITQFSTTPFFFKQSLNHIINTKAFNGALREFFGTSQLSQFMDQLNPLAEITHKRRLSSMGPGGVTRDSATLAIRGIHPTHYGRICPIETPEGKNTGLVNSLTTYARANPQGFLESPFYRVYKGQIQKNDGIYFFSAEQEEKIKVAAADVSSFSGRIGFLPKSKIPAKIGYSDTISKISRNKVEYIGVSPIQMISIATSLIPFLEHDDANRALMGSNMQRQAVPLIRAERPLVGTGLESRTVSDSGHAVIAKESGYVAYVSAKKIVIYTIPSY